MSVSSPQTLSRLNTSRQKPEAPYKPSQRPRGRYTRLQDTIEQLYIYQGVSRSAIAEAFGLNKAQLSNALARWGFTDVKRIRDKHLAEEAARETT